MHNNQQSILVSILNKKGFKLQASSSKLLGFEKNTSDNQIEIPLLGNETSFNVKFINNGETKITNVSGFDGLKEFLEKIH